MIRRRSRRGLTRRAPERLRLTSMMDILTVLLLFLLKSFVVDGEVATPPPDVELPGSTAKAPPEASLVIAISDDAILLGGRPVTTVAAALAGEGLTIAELDARLDEAWTRMEDLAARKGGAAGVDAKVTIQGDRTLEFRLLERVMYTCSRAGFPELALAVARES